jgi:predicted nucleotidyltransferase
MDLHDYRPLLDRLVSVAAADDRILAVLLYGSHATGEADAYSDIDVGLVATDSAFDQLVAEGPELIRKVGEPLLIEDFGDPTNLQVILADGGHMELIWARAGNLVVDGPYRALLDKAGVLEQAIGRPPAQASAEDVRRLIQSFWHDVGHVITAIGRGQTLWAHGQLEELRRVCLNLARLQAGGPLEGVETYWKVEDAVAARHLDALRATIVPPDAGPMHDAALRLVRLYRELATDLAASYGIPYPAELDRLLSGQLERLIAPLRG